ncbi:TetR/AcrR family transcriptional regulator [Streptomyces sp. JJ38]|uniref:TetR/AcrR family transcriptional regulator n=1 Tax=Streptomyces sp. JJ38 TaxID=2738128 RepID=UPI001C56A381|nr:TetR/AcrR family transcriptional regulator [Streptomyces sp. JJ38]MBW1597061.1 TetR/AcrR family transcriptional regulator [Streptomyces sp. JJ38]
MTTTEHAGSGDLHRSMALLWGTAQPASRGPKPGLSVSAVVAAAVDVADEEGIAALSMRKVAERLGVGTMSLYRHVPGKGELLDLMLDHVQEIEGLEEHRGEDWRTTLELVARGTWQLCLRHPWLLQINQTRPVLGPNGLAAFDFALAGLRGLGLTGREKVAMLVTLDNYVVGTARTTVLAQRAAEESGVSDEEFWSAQTPYLEKAMASGAYPEVAALPENVFESDGLDLLDFGLEPLLDGFAATIAARADLEPEPEPGRTLGTAMSAECGHEDAST